MTLKSIVLFPLLLTLFEVSCSPKIWARQARVITCFKKWPQEVRVPINNIVAMEFPDKPGPSTPGTKDFAFTFVKNDIQIKGLVSGGRANYFVYVGGKRCSFKLKATNINSDDIIIVRYPAADSVEVKYDQ